MADGPMRRKREVEDSGGPAGPGSVAWKVNGEIAVLLGWPRAILMQLAHPMVAAGVAEHSGFRAGPFHPFIRLLRTVNAMLALTFGPVEEATRAAAGINAIHDRVNGRLADETPRFPAGSFYSARDPDLLCWVLATLQESLPLAYERYVGPLTAAEKDRYCAEAGLAGPLLGIPKDLIPTEASALRRFIDGMVAGDEIAVTETARALAHDLLHPSVPIPAKPLTSLMRLHTVGLLPPEIRRGYGFRWTAQDEAMMAHTTPVIKRVVRATPAAVRRWPAATLAAWREYGCS